MFSIYKLRHMILAALPVCDALAEHHPTAQSHAQHASLTSLLPSMAAFMAIVYFLLIKPQKQRENNERAMQNALKAGDEVIVSGFLGTIQTLDEHYAVLSIFDQQSCRVQKSAISHVLPKGTIKAIGDGKPTSNKTKSSRQNKSK